MSDESATCLNDALLASRVSAAIVETYPKSAVTCVNGEVLVTNQGNIAQADPFKKQIERLVSGIEGISRTATKIWSIVDTA